ncbi:hypothetical protein B0A52_05916 [Exophiala mesophila]|uniref:Uncharacterized protein n=1 Tax=Exophiala mesophila TaxID=212818 RepID=A0A438N4E7_EXOME|nr:hypothetical protein B0A52_05916 [Exophiala mesophila]
MHLLTPEGILVESCLRILNLANSTSAHLTEYSGDNLYKNPSFGDFVDVFLRLRKIVREIQDGVSREAAHEGRLPRQLVEELVARMDRTAQSLISADLALIKLIMHRKKKGIRKMIQGFKSNSFDNDMSKLSRSLSQDYDAMRIGWLALSESLEQPGPIGTEKLPTVQSSVTEWKPNVSNVSSPSTLRYSRDDTPAVHAQQPDQTFNDMASVGSIRREQGVLPPGLLATGKDNKLIVASRDGATASEHSLIAHSPRQAVQEPNGLVLTPERGKLLPAQPIVGHAFITDSGSPMTLGGVDLVSAVRRKDHQNLKYALEKGVLSADLDRLDLLSQAVQGEDILCTKLLLTHGATVDHIDQNGFSIILLATATLSVELTRQLLDHGASPDFGATSARLSPLVLAALNGQNAIVELLLSHGSNANALLAEGETPFIACIRSGVNIDIVKTILDSGAAPDGKTSDGKTPLVEAIISRRLDIVTALLDKGASPNLAGPKHPLWQATYYPPALKLLLSRGAKPKMATGIMELAASINNIESIKILLAAGESPNQRKDGLYTPLCSAIRDNRGDIVALLLEHNADPNLAASEYPAWKCISHGRFHLLPSIVAKGANLLEPAGILELAVAHNNLEAMSYLLEKGIDVNAHNAKGQTPLTTAIRENLLRCVDLLLKHGADVLLRGEDWPLCMAVSKPAILRCLLRKLNDTSRVTKGVMELAVRAGQLDSVKLLYKAGISVEDKSGGVFSPLTSAVRDNHKAIVRFLLEEAGADVNEPGEHLPLIKAIRQSSGSNDTETIQLLLESGADVNLMYRGWNAVMQAIEKGNPELLRLLIDKGNGIDLQTIDPESGKKVIDIVQDRGWSEGIEMLMECQHQVRMITSTTD